MAETAKNKFQSEFEALPLEEKLKTLLRLEAATLTETFNFAVNEPMKVVEKFGEVVADIGRKVEEEFKKATASRTQKTPTRVLRLVIHRRPGDLRPKEGARVKRRPVSNGHGGPGAKE